MKPAAHGLAAATFAAALAFAPGLALAQTTSTQNTTGATGMSQTGAGTTGAGTTGTAATGMAAPAGQGTSTGMVPGTPAGHAAASGNDNQAVVTTPANATTPAHGANSFTRGEVTRRLAARGFSHASGLKKDKNGVWRGQATHDGATTGVWVDYKGNVGAGDAQYRRHAVAGPRPPSPGNGGRPHPINRAPGALPWPCARSPTSTTATTTRSAS